MLSPNDRLLYLESLRPPDGYTLSSAVGTTYSLDLLTLLVTPLGFTLFDLDPTAASIQENDPLELLEAIRSHAERITIFCQAGRIAVPGRHRPLFTYLEPRVVEARAPAQGRSFHPKVWVLRYESADGPVLYRFLCLSRNLTFDRCWDTILILEGQYQEGRVRGFPRSRPLAEFIGALPSMAVRPLVEGQQADLTRMVAELPFVDFEVPEPFDDYALWPLGHREGGNKEFHKRLDQRTGRTLVVSPFLSSWPLNRVAGDNGPNVLVSRQASLDALPNSTVDKYQECYCITAQNTLKDATESDQASDEGVEAQGLHAKLLVLEVGKATSVVTGSANATTSALEGNVEFAVELMGRTKDCGIDQFLGKEPGTTSFSDLLEVYQRPETPLATDADLEQLEGDLDLVRNAIAAVPWTITVGPDESGDAHQLTVEPGDTLQAWQESFTVRCRPLSLQEHAAAEVPNGSPASLAFGPLATGSLTSFLVFDVSGTRGRHQRTIAFVVNAPLVGAPGNRREEVLRQLLRDKAAVIRFLMLLLADLSDDFGLVTSTQASTNTTGVESGAATPALLEVLLRALDREPHRLTAVERLLKDLDSSEEGRELVPAGLPELFSAIWAARDEEAA